MGAYSQAAAALRERGYSVIPITPASAPFASAGKAPGDIHNGRPTLLFDWQKYCDGQASDADHAHWEACGSLGLGLALGEVVAVDIDSDDAVDVVRRALPYTRARKRGRKGETLFFRSETVIENAAWSREGERIVDFLGYGRQTVLPPSPHPVDGIVYAWTGEEALDQIDIDDLEPVPENIIELLDVALAEIRATRTYERPAAKKSNSTPKKIEYTDGDDFFRNINETALNNLESWVPDLDLPNFRTNGGSFRATAFWRPSSSGKSLEQRAPNLSFSPQGIVDFGDERTYTAIDVTMCALECTLDGAINWLSKKLGIDDGEPISLRVDSSALKMLVPDTKRTPEAHKEALLRAALPEPPKQLTDAQKFDEIFPVDFAEPFPDIDHAVSGPLKTVRDAIRARSVRRGDAIALSLAMSLVSLAMARAWSCPTGLGTNLYFVTLMPSGAGKSVNMNVAADLAMAANLGDHIIGSEIASKTAIYDAIQTNPRSLWMIDEFGEILKEMTAPRAAEHKSGILRVITDLFSKSHNVWQRPIRAIDGAGQVNIWHPHFLVNGIATPQQFWDAFVGKHAENGALARFLLIDQSTRLTRQAPDESLTDYAVADLNMISKLSRFDGGNLQGQDMSEAEPTRQVIPFTDEAAAARDALIDRQDDISELASKVGARGGPEAINRVQEHAVKMALVLGLSSNPQAPRVDIRAWKAAEEWAWWSTKTLVSKARTLIADTPREQMLNKILNLIRTKGLEGAGRNAITRASQSIDTRTRDDILRTLIESEQVVEEVVATGKRKKTVFRAI